MKFKTILLAALMAFGFAFNASAQLKIGHANIELILAYMPETKSMTQTLQTYQTQLGKKLETKQTYAQQKLAEAQQAQQNGASDADLQKYQEELQKLDKEIQEEAAEADQKLTKKRMDLMEPITDKLEKAIKEVANEQSYDYIFNSVDGAGVSIVLHGPEDRDLTKTIMKKLGIEVPADADGGSK